MIKKIIISGGKNSGKTTIIEKIKRLYEIQGIKVIVVDDSVEELINNNNIDYIDYGFNVSAFTNLVIEKEILKRKLLEAYLKVQKRDVLVIYNRESKLNNIYATNKELSSIEDYDLVINLLGDSDNNAKYDRIINVLPKEQLEDKIHEVFNIINGLLGKDEVIRQEKYLVDLTKTHIGVIAAHSNFVKIEQTCLYSDEDKEIRLRKLTINGSYYYIYTEYGYVDGKRHLVLEKGITEKEYRLLLELRNKELDTMIKYRHYIYDNGVWMYIDFFEDKKEIGMLEINVGKEDEVRIPDYIKVIDRVSDEENKYNKKLTFKMGDNNDIYNYRSNA